MEQPYMFVYSILSEPFLLMPLRGNLRGQGISRHGIDHISQIIPSPASEELIIPPISLF